MGLTLGLEHAGVAASRFALWVVCRHVGDQQQLHGGLWSGTGPVVALPHPLRRPLLILCHPGPLAA